MNEKIVSKYEAVITSTKTNQGYKSGICLIKKKNVFVDIDIIKKYVNCCYFKEGYHDCYDIDYILYKAITSVKLKNILAIGCNIFIDWMPYNTGGILGSPHKEAKSSNSNIEIINSDLSMYTSPGNIGFVVECSRNTMKSILQNIDFSSHGKKLINNVLSTFNDFCIKTAIIITDGSGFASKGYVVAVNDGFINIICINE